MSITRRLITVGAAIDGIAVLLYLILSKDVAVDHAPLTPVDILAAIGLAAFAVIGTCLILAAVIINVVAASNLNYADGVRHGVRDCVETWVGRLMEALPEQSGNVLTLRRRDDQPPRRP